jgi:hypothetical protein
MAWIFDLGAYRDSGRNTALVAGAGGLWSLSEHVRVGGALVVLDSDTYNRGKTAIAPLPLAAFETRSVTFNFVYFPPGLGDQRRRNPGLLGDLVDQLGGETIRALTPIFYWPPASIGFCACSVGSMRSKGTPFFARKRSTAGSQ